MSETDLKSILPWEKLLLFKKLPILPCLFFFFFFYSIKTNVLKKYRFVYFFFSYLQSSLILNDILPRGFPLAFREMYKSTGEPFRTLACHHCTSCSSLKDSYTFCTAHINKNIFSYFITSCNIIPSLSLSSCKTTHIAATLLSILLLSLKTKNKDSVWYMLSMDTLWQSVLFGFTGDISWLKVVWLSVDCPPGHSSNMNDRCGTAT